MTSSIPPTMKKATSGTLSSSPGKNKQHGVNPNKQYGVNLSRQHGVDPNMASILADSMVSIPTKTWHQSEHGVNRRFPEITGEDNLTMFSYSGRVKSPEWRRQRRRADLRHFEIFRHGPIIIYTRLPAGGTYYPICTFPASS